MCRALELTELIFDTADTIKEEWKTLSNRLSIADQKRNDIQHYIELSTLNAAQGYNAYRLLKEVLEERRTIKNQIDEMRKALDFINGTKLVHKHERQKVEYNITKVHDLNTKNVDNKRYNVRVMTEIFGDTIR